MFKKILAASLVFSLVSSLVLAQEIPGKAVPVASQTSVEGIPLLNSAPGAPSGFNSLSEITVTTEAREAVLEFSTDTETHVVIEYGLTPDYEHSITTEPQTEHTETLGELTACARYYYAVRAGDESREGDFTTLCPVVKKAVKKTVKPVITKTPPVAVSETVIDTPTPTISQPEIVLNAAPEEVKNEQGTMNNAEIVAAAPESPALPGPIAFGDDTVTPESAPNTAPVALILFALLSGMIVAFFALKKKKKWYQK